jgi:hypothetical protein
MMPEFGMQLADSGCGFNVNPRYGFLYGFLATQGDENLLRTEIKDRGAVRIDQYLKRHFS